MIDTFKDEHAFLSNFFPCDINMDLAPYHDKDLTEIVYPTAEHAFVAMKTLDLEQRIHIATIATPGQAKRYGRQLDLRPDWNAIRIAVMHYILQQKFYENRYLAHLLLDTRAHILVEGNTWGDQFWGMERNGIGRWIGENWLGRLLMLVRSTFLLEESDA